MTNSISATNSLQLNLTPAIAATPQNTAPSFGHGEPGVFYIPTPYQAVATKMLIQADGRIVIGGATSNGAANYTLVRLNTDGTLDTTFDADGIATVGLTTNASLTGLALAPDGSFYAGGNTVRTGAFQQFALTHFNADGSVDTDFGTNGVALTALSVRTDIARAMMVQADGKVILAGYTSTTASPANNGSYRDFALVRYNTDGTLDTTFDGDGIAVTSLGTTWDAITSLTPLAGGQFLALGSQVQQSGGALYAVLARYNANGSIDTTFGTDGFIKTPLHDGTALATTNMMIDATGHIIVIGQENRGLGDSSTTPFILRYNADGSLDTTFSGDGKVTFEIGTFIDNLYKVVQQADGKLLVAGLSFYTDVTNHGFILRINADGTLDTTFGVSGVLHSPFPNPGDDSFQDMVLQANGKIVVTGFRGPDDNGFPDMMVVRYNADGTLDTTFNTDSTLGDTVAYTERAAAVILDADASVYDAQLAAIGSYSGSTLTLARHGGASSQDVFGASGDVALAGGSIVADGATVGTYTNSNGTLSLHFGNDATQGLVNLVMSSITYANGSRTPPDSVTIDWTFNDGNTGTQGEGGAKSSTGTTTVNITAIDDMPITPSPGNHDLEGTSGGDLFVSGSGRDTMTGGAGDDTYVVNSSGDVVIEEEGGGTDTIETKISYKLPDNVENLTLLRAVKGVGNELDNVIIGSDGKDDIVGGLGADTLTGGNGQDRFYLNALNESPAVSGQWDVITDFSSDDKDKIVLKRIDANDERHGNQAFTFIGSAEFSQNATGQLRFDPVTHMLYGSVDADADAEFAIELTGVTSLTARDFDL